jgi:hypothetical protein
MPVEIRKCPTCGADNPAKRLECFKCGEPLEQSMPSQGQSSRKAKPKEKISWPYIIIGIAIALFWSVIRPAIFKDVNATSTSSHSADTTQQRTEQFNPEWQAVVDEFSVLDSRIEVGMNYADYASAVGDLKVSLDRFKRRSGGVSDKALGNIMGAFSDYEFALVVWREYIEGGWSNDAISLHKYIEIYENYYGAKPTRFMNDGEWVDLPHALKTFWQSAKNKVEKAQ